MLFTEFAFLLFLAVVFAGHWALRGLAPRKAWLLVASYAFYAGWDWRFLGLILASTVIDYVVGRVLSRPVAPAGRGARRAWLVLSLVTNLGLLAAFKYYDFFAESAAELLGALGVETTSHRLELILPVGISFYTFQTLSYTIDIYRGRLEAVRSPLDFALFVAFFPQLVAGPIVRATSFLPQLVAPRRFADVGWRAAATLFLVGYVKKACVADNVAVVVDGVFAAPEAWGAGAKWLALALYSIQIYCDFSGYSDMAIATAAAFGYRLPLNFDFPYLSASVTEFWRRWHISLSTWFRDYLYIPLGGNRGGPARTYLNLFLVFLLCGLWHGASWNFVVWGLIHGVFLVLERAGLVKARGALGLVWTLLVVMLAWVFFRSPDLPSSTAYVAGLFGSAGERALDAAWWLLVAGFALVHVAMSRRWLERAAGALPDLAFSAAYGVAWALVHPWASADYQPFIYFQF
jgi:alginate O-acetyltransferase complex protein AlgI